MSPQRKTEDAEVTQLAEGDDAENPSAFEHPNADDVREGKLSAAQLPGGGGNVDPDNPDAQYPAGRIDNLSPVATASEPEATMVPTRTVVIGPTKTADANPDFS